MKAKEIIINFVENLFLTIFGIILILFTLIEYIIFAPFYYLFELFKKIKRMIT